MVRATKEQKHLEDLSKWIQQGSKYKGFDDLTEMFRRFYGLEHMEIDTPAYMESWEKESENFLESFKDYQNLISMVSKDDHLALVKKYKELKEKVVGQKETIKSLRLLLEEKKDRIFRGTGKRISGSYRQAEKTVPGNHGNFRQFFQEG